MYGLEKDELLKLGAEITVREVKQQPALWLEAYEIYKAKKNELTDFLEQFSLENEGQKIRVIFTGAGTSQYVGDALVPSLRHRGNSNKYEFESIATTDIVARPEEFLKKDVPTVLVSFARSGNSPESIATVKIADKFVNCLRHIFITCAPNGKLAQFKDLNHPSYVWLMPAKSNDAGFAMTGSFSCMFLSAMLLFDIDESTKEDFVNLASKLGREVILKEEQIEDFTKGNFNRVVYLGSGSLAGLTREAQLKLLELTAGKIATMSDSSMGFRHGPKSFVDDKTLVFVFVNNDEYTRQYDLDILNEVYSDRIAKKVVAVAQGFLDFKGEVFEFSNQELLPDGYMVLPDVMFAQTLALFTSLKVGNKPDTPSPTGTVNRVVKGVLIHEYEG